VRIFLRIIGGELRGRRLTAVKGSRVRPTTGKHRESIFNILSSQIDGATVLDLFAGTGALGIEALSRGASRAVFVDNFQSALDAAAKNLEACSLESRAKLFRRDALRKLNCLKPFSFDLVFMDPPYELHAVKQTMENLDNCGCLKNGALIVAEHSVDEVIGDEFENFALTDRRRFGKTLVSFFRFM
jgi:16S rRNA (guanine966-N2)-methyltransferase